MFWDVADAEFRIVFFKVVDTDILHSKIWVRTVDRKLRENWRKV